jgi:hypothetical protein
MREVPGNSFLWKLQVPLPVQWLLPAGVEIGSILLSRRRTTTTTTHSSYL